MLSLPATESLSLAESGHAIQFGPFEAAAAAVLYACDPEYRRRKKAERRAEDKSFGACLRRLRVLRGLTQGSFEGVTRKTIQRIENGKTPKTGIQRATMQAIASALGVEPAKIEDY